MVFTSTSTAPQKSGHCHFRSKNLEERETFAMNEGRIVKNERENTAEGTGAVIFYGQAARCANLET